MQPRLFVVPYDSGHRGIRMGAGPSALAAALSDFASEEIAPETEWRAEIRTTFELYRNLARGVRAAVDRGEFPVVLAGNCGACVGTAAGVGTERLAVIWFDAHGDFMTPETTESGFLDSMGLSLVNGRCWSKLVQSIPHFEPVPTTRAMHLGGHDFNPGEQEELVRAGVACLDAATLHERGIEATLIPALDRLAADADRLLVHIDLDVLDPRFGRANEYAADGGLAPDEVVRIIELAAARLPLAAIELASYDPRCDTAGTIAQAGVTFVRAALRA